MAVTQEQSLILPGERNYWERVRAKGPQPPQSKPVPLPVSVIVMDGLVAFPKGYL